MPELSDLSKEERNKLWYDNVLKGFLHWQTWAAFFVFMAWSYFIFLLVHYLRNDVFNSNSIVFRFLYAVFGCGVGYIVFWIIFAKMVRSHISKARNN